MAKFKISEVVDPSANMTVLLGASTSTPLNDNDIGKPLKWAGTDRYVLCANGDPIEGFLASVQDATADGYAVGTMIAAKSGTLKRVELDGAVTLGAYVEAAAPAAVNTAEANGLGKVSVRATPVAGDNHWRLVSGTGLDGDTTAVVMCV